MVTAADGADSFYQKTNNHTRTETIEQAREMDAKAVQVYVVLTAPNMMCEKRKGLEIDCTC